MLRKLICTVALSWPALTMAQTTWNMATGYPENIFHTQNIVQFANQINEASEGELKVVVHSGGSLFKVNEIKRAVQGGQVQIGEVIISGLANEDPVYGLDSLPFLVTTYEQARQLADLSTEVISNKLDRQGMKLLYMVPWTPQGLYANHEVNSVADLEGSKMRAYNPATARIAELVGAQAVTIQPSEFSQALAMGVVETFMTSAASGYDFKVWETTQYFYDVQAWMPKNMVIVSKKAFNALSPEVQQNVLDAAQAASERGWAMSEEQAKITRELLVEEGMTVQAPSEQLTKDLMQVGETMIAEWMEKAGEENSQIVEELRKK